MSDYIQRGDIYYADLSPVVGSEQGGVRPVLVIQNDKGNRFSPTIIVAAMTTSQYKAGLPTHIHLGYISPKFWRESTILTEQIRTLDKSRLKEYIGRVDDHTMESVDEAILISVGIPRQKRV